MVALALVLADQLRIVLGAVRAVVDLGRAGLRHTSPVRLSALFGPLVDLEKSKIQIKIRFQTISNSDHDGVQQGLHRMKLKK